MKSLIVIGAGISGLTCAIYAQRSGFKTLVLEKAANPGGISTSWKRKGYKIEGGIHWLTGAKKGVPLNDVWTETGALGTDNPVVFKDPVYTLVDGDVRLELHRDSRRLYKELSAFAPEDKGALAVMRFHVWCFTFFHSPILDLPGLKVKGRHAFNPLEFLKMGPVVLFIPYLMSLSTRRYLRRFRNPHVRALLESVVDPEINALSFIYTMSTFASGDGGYPVGGSLEMARNMEAEFLDMGGEIRYRTPALEVVTENGRYAGVRTEAGMLKSDAVVVSADARTAIDKLFGSPLQTSWAKRMRKKLNTAQCMFIALGIKQDLSGLPLCMRLVLRKPLRAGGLEFHALTVNNYASYPGYAPEDCSTVTVILPGRCYDYWKAARENGTYRQLKQEAIDAFAAVLAEALPETKGEVAMSDMATPLTFERYCDTFEGSYMSEWKPCHFNANAPVSYLHGLYFTGQRLGFSGGLPVAAETGRRTAQTLCRDYDMVFVSR